jgi:hypothetical protein
MPLNTKENGKKKVGIDRDGVLHRVSRDVGDVDSNDMKGNMGLVWNGTECRAQNDEITDRK